MQNRIKTTFKLYNSTVKEILKQDYQSSSNQDQLLQSIRQIAFFASNVHPGLLCDYRLETQIRNIGNLLFPKLINSTKARKKHKKVLHIGTTYYEVGGHTRIVSNWIKADKQNEHYVLMTNQITNFPSLLFKNVPIYCLDTSKSDIEKAKQIRNYILKENFDLIILNIHPEDVCALLAITNTNIPKLLYNHAETRFWLGVSFVNAIIDFSSLTSSMTKEMRSTSTIYLPYILGNQLNLTKLNNHQKEAIRRELKIPYKKVLLTMGYPYKYRSFKQYNFFKFYELFLKDNSDVGLYVIGMSNKDYENIHRNKLKAKNIHLLGKIGNPKAYLQCADIFVEPFPMGTGLGTMEAVISGAVPLLNYGSVNIYERGCDFVFADLMEVDCTTNIVEYQNQLVNYLKDDKKLALSQKKFQEAIQRFYMPEWSKYLEHVYTTISKYSNNIKLQPNLKICFEGGHKKFNAFNTINTLVLVNDYLNTYKGKLTLKMYLFIIFNLLIRCYETNPYYQLKTIYSLSKRYCSSLLYSP